jgi:hypothetical protein
MVCAICVVSDWLQLTAGPMALFGEGGAMPQEVRTSRRSNDVPAAQMPISLMGSPVILDWLENASLVITILLVLLIWILLAAELPIIFKIRQAAGVIDGPRSIAIAEIISIVLGIASGFAGWRMIRIQISKRAEKTNLG